MNYYKKSMNEKTKAQLQEKITTAVVETEDTILALQKKTKPISPDNAIGRLSRMDAIGNKSVNDASLRNARERLTKLKYALSHLDSPGFGICAECDEEIPIARIMVMPESILCVSCAERTE